MHPNYRIYWSKIVTNALKNLQLIKKGHYILGRYYTLYPLVIFLIITRDNSLAFRHRIPFYKFTNFLILFKPTLIIVVRTI